MANFHVDYPNMTNNFATGVNTGMQLGGMINRKRQQQQPDTSKQPDTSAIPIALPSEKPQVDIDQELGDVHQGIAKYGEDYKQFSSIKNSVDMPQAILATAKVAPDPITKALYTAKAYGIDIKPDEVNKALMSVRNGEDPKSSVPLNVLKSKMGSEGAKAIDAKIADIQNKQKQLNYEWGNSIKDTLLNVNRVQEDPKKHMGKTGNFDPSVIEATKNETNYVQELYPIDKDWTNKYLQMKTMQRVSASKGSDKISFQRDKNGYLGVYRNGQLDLSQSDKLYTTQGATPITQQDFVWALMHQGQFPNKAEIGGNPSAEPVNPEGKKILKRNEEARPSKEEKPDKFGFTIGQERKLKNGKTVKYIGNDQWQ